MPDANKPVGPAINDSYWFAFSKELIDTGVTRRDEAASNLQKFVLWLWSIYTAAAAVGFALASRELSLAATLAITSGSVLLICVYWSAVWTQMPKLVRFDPRSPVEIRYAHNEMILARNRRLAVTALLSVAAAAMVSVGLIVASVARPRDTVASIASLLTADPGGGTAVSVTAVVPGAGFADVAIEPMPAKSGDKSDNLALRLVPLRGAIQTSMTIKTELQSAWVRVTWTDSKDVEHRLSQNVKPAATTERR
jgi:hypothetical protein